MEPIGEIPKIIHQTWKSEDIPAEWAGYVRSWKDLHPHWQYRLWTDNANRDFVAEHYPGFLPTYDAYPYAIQRADAVRYCLLHHFGGVYVDMDIECLRPLDQLIDGRDFVAVYEPESQAAWLGRESVISNAFMASNPGHSFLEAIIIAMANDPSGGVSHLDVLGTTGPIMMSRVLDSYNGNDVSVLSSNVAFPYVAHSLEINVLRERTPGYDALMQGAINRGAYAVHYWANTWMKTLAGELSNPEPYAIEGFDFFPGLDSPGNDIANVGRDIKQAAKACRAMPDAIAFNTDGFAKWQLWPRDLWQSMGSCAWNEGLYVKKKPGPIERLLPGWLRRR